MAIRRRAVLTSVLMVLWLSVTAEAAISRVTQASAQTNGSSGISITVQANDTILTCAHRDGNNTAPTLATNYTNIASGGANTNSMRCGYLVSDGSDTTCGTWTNATSTACVVFRGADVFNGTPVGLTGFGAGGANSNSIAYNTDTLEVSDGTSWVVGCGAHRTATNVGQAPTGMTLVTSATDIACSDTEAGVSSWTTQSVTVNASSGWRSYTIEIRAAPSSCGAGLCVQQRKTAATCPTSSITAVFPGSVTAGSVILVGAASTGTTTDVVTSVTDSKSNTYSRLNTTSGGGDRAYLYAASNVAAGLDTVTLNVTGSFAWCLTVYEILGAATTGQFDGNTVTLTNPSNTTTDGLVSGNITPGTSGDMIFGLGWMDNTAQAATSAAGTGFTSIHGTVIASNFHIRAEQQIQGSAATIQATWTGSSSGTGPPFFGHVVAVKPVPTSTAGCRGRLLRMGVGCDDEAR